MAFLSKDFEIEKTDSNSDNYMRFEEGENRLRILTDAIEGYEYWLDSDGNIVPRNDKAGKGGKPVRRRTMADVAKESIEAQYDTRQFIAFVVWNYAKGRMQILEIKQKTIMQKLVGWSRNEDWKDLTAYDIIIKRDDSGDFTQYEVDNTLPKEFTEDISGLSKVKLEALYDNGDPFEDLTDMNENITDKEIDEIFPK